MQRPVWDIPGSPVVKNPPCNAGDAGSIPDGGTEIPQAEEQLSLESLCCNERCNKAPATKTRRSQTDVLKIYLVKNDSTFIKYDNKMIHLKREETKDK